MTEAERANLYRSRANEIRTMAQGVANADTRRALLQLADSYEVLAKRLENSGTGAGT